MLVPDGLRELLGRTAALAARLQSVLEFVQPAFAVGHLALEGLAQKPALVALGRRLKSLEECRSQLPGVDGVMVGREAYQNPYLLADVDNLFYGTKKPKKSRSEILERLYPYIEQEINDGAQLKYISRHILGLFQGMPGARAWRRHISEQAFKPGAGVDVIKTAARFVIPD